MRAPRSTQDVPDETRDPSASPTRGGTLDWDDRIVMAAALLGDASIAVGVVGGPSPVRGGTLPWDELLPPAVQHRYRAHHAARTPSRRSDTLPWDMLLAVVADELAAAEAGPKSGPVGDTPAPGPTSVRVEATQMVFEPPGRDPDEPSTDDMLRCLAPDSTSKK